MRRFGTVFASVATFETRGYPEVAEGELGQAILSRLIDLSIPYGTTMELVEGSAKLRIGDEAMRRGLEAGGV